MGFTKKALGVYKRYGLHGFCQKLAEKINSPVRLYHSKINTFLPTNEELKQQRGHSFQMEPYLSIVIPAYETDPVFLQQLLEAIRQQTYQNIELCIADASKSNQVEEIICQVKEAWSHSNPKLKIAYSHLKENNGISENTNEALKLVTGAYVGFMDHDDVLTKNAAYEVISTINTHPDAQIIYSDEDKVTYDLKKHTQPHFKPDFNMELLRDNNYICHFLVVSKELLDKIGGLQKEYDGSQDYDFVLRAVEQTSQIYHIPKILYHWRMHKASTAGDSDSKTYTFDAGQRALEAHFKRQNIKATVEKRIEVGCFHIRYDLPEDFKKEDYILQKTDNIRPLTNEWLKELYAYCSQKNVGIVAAKVIKSNNSLKGNGLIYQSDGTARYSFAGLNENYKGYVRRAVLAQDLSAVSLDFAMIKKEAWDAVGGVDTSLPSPYRDLDFCLKLKKAGYRVIQDSFVEGKELFINKRETKNLKIERPVLEKAREVVKNRHSQSIEQGDCNYNPNFSNNRKTFSL